MGNPRVFYILKIISKNVLLWLKDYKLYNFELNFYTHVD